MYLSNQGTTITTTTNILLVPTKTSPKLNDNYDTIVLSPDISLGLLAYATISSKDIYSYDALCFYIRTSIAIPTETIQLVLDNNNAFSGEPLEFLNIQTLPANKWQRILLLLNNPDLDTAITNVGIHLKTLVINFTIDISEITLVKELQGFNSYSITENVDMIDATNYNSRGSKQFKSGLSTWTANVQEHKETTPPFNLRSNYLVVFLESSITEEAFMGECFYSNFSPSGNVADLVKYSYILQGTRALQYASTKPEITGFISMLWYGERGIFAGGSTTGYHFTGAIDYITIASIGNATNFGSLTTNNSGCAGCSNSSRGVIGGGRDEIGYDTPILNTIEYITIASTGNATDFGDLATTKYLLSSCSNGIFGVFAGGNNGTQFNTIEYIQITSLSDSLDFGDLTGTRYEFSACSSMTKGIFVGGNTGGSSINIIEYITFATVGNSVDFGDLTTDRDGVGSCSNKTRGIFCSGRHINAPNTYANLIDYIETASLENATSFGNLANSARFDTAACNNETRAVFGGGDDGNNLRNYIDYITIASLGNSTDFGDLTSIRGRYGACSGT